MMQENFFLYQHKALRPLLVWGLLSSLGGTLLLLLPGLWRHFGLQALVWGVIDLLLAVAGRRGALRKAAALAAGAIDAAGVTREARNFRTILAVNSGLDLLYILIGLAVAARWAERADRRGLGYGVALQGAFLLIFDGLLVRDVTQRLRQGL
jgi:hypothetical protein